MLDLKNNFMFAPIKTGYGKGDGKVTDRHAAFYAARSEYLGSLTLEPPYLDKGLRELPTQIGIDNDDKIEELNRLNNSMHANDTRVVVHLNHPGRMANPKIPGNYFISSTDKPCENGGATPKKMDTEDMKKVIQLFADAAVRSEKAGFDIIELQCGHGYLLAQFISPAVNDRDDEYGGSFENRTKFPLQVCDAVKNATGLPIIVRISGDEMIPNGIKLPEMIKLSKILKEKGVQAMHVSAGSVCSTPPWYFQHMFTPKSKTWEMAEKIKEAVNIPVVFVGQINTFEDIDKIKNDYPDDYIAIGRALIADPGFIGKYLGKIKGVYAPCLACAEGCLGGVKSGQGLQCLVNPTVGRETQRIEKAKQPKRYAVVGGGLAGMEAAITLKERGHDIDLYEKDKLGGQFNLAPLTPHKRSMAKLVPYLIERLKEEDVSVIFKEAAKTDLVSKYDGVILATGSISAVPKIPGLNKFYWADILLEEKLPENKNVFIIGGGLIGVDIATALIPRNNKVTIVKRTTDFGEDMEMIAKLLSLRMMKEKGVVFSDHTYIKRIEGKTVYAERDGKQIQFDNVDIFVVSTGMKSYNPLEDKLKQELPTYVIGDAMCPGNAQDAIRDGYEIGLKL
ncbi:MAG: FAD-dependent oxidoreductase [Campylobacterota bacterium]|nr:FAD-dependent oxidoreductase [Campylobacterota bacterium]